MLGVQEKVAERFIPKYIKDKLNQTDQRLEALEQWKAINVSQWAQGVDTTLEELGANEKSLNQAQVATADNLKTARSDAADLAISRLAIPDSMSAADLGGLLKKIKDLEAQGTAKFPGGTFFDRAWQMFYVDWQKILDAGRTWSTKWMYITNPGGTGVVDRYYDVMNTIDDWKYRYSTPIKRLVDNGLLPDKASSTIQGWISAQADAIKGTISATQLTTDKLNAISALMNTVPGTQKKLIDTLTGISQWYQTKETYITSQIDTYIGKYNSDALPTLMSNYINKYTGASDFKTALLAKLAPSDLKDKLKDYLMNIPGVKGLIDDISAVYEDTLAFAQKLVAGLKEAKRVLTDELPANVKGQIDTITTNIAAYKKRLSTDLDRKPSAGIWTADLVKEYAKDAANDVKQMAEYAVSSIGSFINDIIVYFLKKAFAAMVDPVKDLTISAFDKETIKAKVTGGPA